MRGLGVWRLGFGWFAGFRIFFNGGLGVRVGLRVPSLCGLVFRVSAFAVLALRRGGGCVGASGVGMESVEFGTELRVQVSLALRQWFSFRCVWCTGDSEESAC